jgi:hypothetical protein
MRGVQVQCQGRSAAGRRGIGSQRWIKRQPQRRRLAGSPFRTGQPARPRVAFRLREIVRTRDCVARHRQIPWARDCVTRHREIPRTRDCVARHREIPRTRDCVARHREIPRTRNCLARCRQVSGGTRNRFARRRQVVSQPAGGRSELENSAAVDAHVVSAAGRNIAADFLTSCTFWTDDLENGQAGSPGSPL